MANARLADMFNIGFGEMIMLAAIALIFIGPKQLPEVARVVGRMLNELRRASDDLTGSFVKTRDSFDREVRQVEKQFEKKLNDITAAADPQKLEQLLDPKEDPKKGSS